ncbi:tRNA-splicing endonuclease subunit Sen2-2 [Nymphaea thermarum]|nr:tRNA-splicing endonuclease subunit Sen2-2 [Nymphaea thermarum]
MAIQFLACYNVNLGKCGLLTMRPRWKGKGLAQLALADPMSKIVSKLQSCLTESKSCASLSNEVVLCEAEPEQAELLNRACFGRPVATVTKGRQWFQLGLEEKNEVFVLKEERKGLAHRYEDRPFPVPLPRCYPLEVGAYHEAADTEDDAFILGCSPATEHPPIRSQEQGKHTLFLDLVTLNSYHT